MIGDKRSLSARMMVGGVKGRGNFALPGRAGLPVERIEVIERAPTTARTVLHNHGGQDV